MQGRREEGGGGPNAEEKGEGEREIKREGAWGRGLEVTAAPGPDQALDGPASVAFVDVIKKKQKYTFMFNIFSDFFFIHFLFKQRTECGIK